MGQRAPVASCTARKHTSKQCSQRWAAFVPFPPPHPTAPLTPHPCWAGRWRTRCAPPASAAPAGRWCAQTWAGGWRGSQSGRRGLRKNRMGLQVCQCIKRIPFSDAMHWVLYNLTPVPMRTAHKQHGIDARPQPAATARATHPSARAPGARRRPQSSCLGRWTGRVAAWAGR